jgi:hypothetical protein
MLPRVGCIVDAKADEVIDRLQTEMRQEMVMRPDLEKMWELASVA